MNEQRLESRFMCADMVRIDWRVGEDEPGKTRTTDAVLEDICSQGACVQVEEPIPVTAAITISAGEARLSGYVSYCAFRDYGYFAGITFSEDNAWSSGLFEPQHLTNLRSLGEKKTPPK
jgi:hypothetical protein